MDLVRWQRQALEKRHAIADEVLGGIAYSACRNSLHVWLQLPGDRSEEGFVAQVRLQGVAIAPGLSFRIAHDDWKPAVRISLGSTTEAELRAGLGTVARLLQGEPEHLLLAI